MLNKLRFLAKKRFKEGGVVHSTLWFFSTLFSTRNPIFFVKECFYAPRYGFSHLDLEYYRYIKRLSDFLNGEKVTVIDVGANRGWFVKISYRFFNPIKVIAYEPMELNRRFLSALENKYNVITRYFALSDIEKEVVFKQYETDGLSSLFDLNENFKFEDNFGSNLLKEHRIKTRTLYSDLLELGIDDGNLLIKLDTQGSELDILNGAIELFEAGRVKAVVIELLTDNMYNGQHSWIKILEFFELYGFSMLDIIVGYRNEGKIAEFDAIFVKK